MSDPPQDFYPLAAIQPTLAELAARSAEMENLRRLPADLARKMAETGVFRVVTPKRLGGLEASPQQIVETIETIAAANASAAWCAMISATTGLIAAYMAQECAAEIYANPLTITGGVFAPMGKAIIEGDHYRVSGRWQWASGSINCTWLCGGCTLWENGELRRLPGGVPDTRMMVFPASEAILHDTWHVMGLKGTGSGDIEVKNILVPRGRSVSLERDAPLESGRLYKFPAFGLLALGVSAVALGNSRGAIDAFHSLATAKKNQGSARTLAERTAVQAAYADCVAQWRSARAYLFSEIGRVWGIADRPDAIPVSYRTDLRLACTHMTRTGATVCRALYDLGGGTAQFETSAAASRRFSTNQGQEE